MKSKYKILIPLFILLSFILSSAYLFLPVHFQSLDNRVRDFYFKFRGPQKASEDIVIVDIDERSIKELGQWPWERDKFARILTNLTKNQVGIIGLDIVFSEEDKTSPSKFAKKWKLESKNLPDYDTILSNTIANTPTILGYVFDFNTDNTNEAPQIPAIFIEKNKPQRDYLPLARGVLTNLEVIQNKSYSSGYMNNIPDESGIIRSVPLTIKYQNHLYPSLAFEMYRIASNSKKVLIQYDKNGIETIKLKNFPIKTDRFGRLYLNFRGPFQSYKYISAIDVYNNKIREQDLQGKFVLIGTSAYGLMDLRSTPMDSVIAGVEVHANLIDNLLNNDMLVKPLWIEIADILVIIFIVFTVTIIFYMLSWFMLLLVYSFSFFGIFYLNYYLLFEQYIIINSVFPILSMILSFIGILVVKYLLESKQKDMIKGKFASKVSTDVMEDILKNPDSNTLDGAEKEITVFFSDVRNFTNISEAMENPKSLIKFMNKIMEPMTKIIIDEKGTIDKYIGDTIMAYWNAPLNVLNHPDKAVIASLKQLHHLQKLNEELKNIPEFQNVVKLANEDSLPIVDIGIGINSGVAIVGEMGSSIRSDYTVIGDTINVGARLESLCKYYNSRLNISCHTKNLLKGKYIFRFLDLVTVKGKKEPLEIWQIHNFDDETTIPLFYKDKKKLFEELDLYHNAIKLYKSAKFDEAIEIFYELNSWKNKSNINIYEIYIKRCKHYMDNPQYTFSEIFHHSSKD